MFSPITKILSLSSASTVLSQYKLLIDLNEGCSGWNHSDDIYSIVSILPNYSSAMLMSIKDDIGVCVLADCNIGITIENLAQRIYEVLENKTVSTCTLDTMIKLDFTFIIITIMVFALIVYFIYKAANNKSKDSLGAVVPLEIILTLTTIAMLIYIPLRVKIGWYDLIMTWAPFSVVIGMIFLILGCICGLISSLVLKD